MGVRGKVDPTVDAGGTHVPGILNGAIIGKGIETLPCGTSFADYPNLLACQAALDAADRKNFTGATLYTTAVHQRCFND